jgi:hypothetical protein
MKIKIENIPFTSYAVLLDKKAYDNYLNYSDIKPVDVFNLGAFVDLPFGFVKDMQEYFNYSGLTWDDFMTEISNITGLSVKKIAGYGIFDLKAALNYCQSQIEEINKIESENLGHSPTSEEQQAGIEMFNKYRSFIQFDSLTGGDLTRIEAVRNLDYATCFSKLMLEADRDQYNRNISNIRKNN